MTLRRHRVGHSSSRKVYLGQQRVGVPAVYQAMLPLLREAPQARIVNVSSGVGSLTMNADPANRYRAVFGPSTLLRRRLSTL